MPEDARFYWLYDDWPAIAVKRVVTWRIEQTMQSAGLNKLALVKPMLASRTVVDGMQE